MPLSLDLQIGESKVFEYVEDLCLEIILSPGFYQFEVWGAQGGSEFGNSSYGGYSSGYYSFPFYSTIYACIGSAGNYSNTPSGGFNGGGDGHVGTQNDDCGGGGGSTDIRTVEDNILSRVIIAGGGGGDAVRGSIPPRPGGYGGGLKGGDGLSDRHFGHGGTQTAGGKGVRYSSYRSEDGQPLNGSKAVGERYSGGGGFFGGSGGYEHGGGGGSGYVSPNLIYSRTISGDKMMPQPYGEDSIGKTGNGAVRITRHSSQPQQTKCFSFRHLYHVYFLVYFLC